MIRVFCFGIGYLGLTVARAVLARGGAVAGTCRSVEKCQALAAQGIDAHVFGPESGDLPADALDRVTHLICSVPPDDDQPADPVLRRLGDRLAAELPRGAWIGYLSTTGVYGDHGGAAVDETTPVTPTSPRGRRRARAEADWLAFADRIGAAAHLFRLAGIYGPGRSMLDQVRTGRARRLVKADGHVFNRIHVADAAAAILASMDRPRPGAIYNLADDEPAPSHEVTAFACDLLGVQPPPLQAFETADLSPAARDFWADHKIVVNRRVKEELGVALRFPTYREGLRDAAVPDAGAGQS